MGFVPIDRAIERIDTARTESVSSLFAELMHSCELVMKTVVLTTAAAIDDDRDRHRYGHLYRLVRADSLGAWLGELDDMVVGPSAQHLTKEFLEIRELRESASSGSWQYESALALYEAVKANGDGIDRIPARVDARQWLSLFVTLRNKTSGHGAMKPSQCEVVCPLLEDSLRHYIEGFSLFAREWVYLKQTLSEKYQVVALSGDKAAFSPLATAAGRNYRLQDGVYVHIGKPRRMELITTDLPEQNMALASADFFFPNGKYKRGRYDVLSYNTGTKWQADGSEYSVPAGQLSPSSTEGLARLDDTPDGFGTSLPEMPAGYVNRSGLEAELHELLMESHRHRILTLVGRGGIGKTSLALSVLHSLFGEEGFERFGLCVWFSARDIDLLDDKPVQVRRQVLDEQQCARYFARLLTDRSDEKDFKALRFLEESFTESPLGVPILFVFDNFETVKSPVDFFSWVDTFCRHPNKVVITTRHRDFKGDYPIVIGGMERDEYEELVRETAGSLGISNLVTKDVADDLFAQTGGHPYVTKIFLGECARAGAIRKPEMVLRDRDDILVALFERSFQNLSAPARRVFLTLCNWRSTVPELAISAVIASGSGDSVDVMAAIEELKRTSFVEEIRPSVGGVVDEESSLRLPLEAALFGQKKLQVDPMKLRIEADTKTLQLFGAADATAARKGIEGRVRQLFNNLAREAERDPAVLDAYAPLVDYMGQRYPSAWLMAADLYVESGEAEGRRKAIVALGRFLEAGPDGEAQIRAWRRVAELARRDEDLATELNAWAQVVALPAATLRDVSDASNTLNFLHYHHKHELDKDVLALACERAIAALAPFVDGDASATDLSRLAWLYLNTGEREKAKTVTLLGLERDPLNSYLTSLRERLGLE